MLAVEMDDVFWFESLTSFDLELTFHRRMEFSGF